MPEIWLYAFGTLLTVLTGVALSAWRQINILRNNDMHELRERLTRIETQLTLHIQWHLAGKESK